MPSSNLHAESAAARLAGLLDSAMDGIVTVDATQRIVMYNQAAERIFGHPADAVRGQSLELLIPSRFRGTHAAQVGRFGQTGVTSRRMGDQTVLHGLRANGEEFPIEASISQLETPEGKLFTVILRDVSERMRAQQELAAFAAESAGVREQEKSRIARELHDELAQALTALKMDTISLRGHVQGKAEAQGKLSQMIAMLDNCVASVRRISADLRPLVLDDLGLLPAIEWLVQSFTQRHGVPCELEADEDLELDEPYATAVFRIVQESLVNVAKHAGATRVWVRLAHEGGSLVLSVRDNGRGFRPTDARKPQSLGIAGLRERAHLLRGSVRIVSAPGEGTVVEARIPVGEVAA